MPHIVAKVRAGYSKAQKRHLADALSSAVVTALDCPMFDVSVGIEDVRPNDWSDRVYQPDICEKQATIFKHPGYAPLK